MEVGDASQNFFKKKYTSQQGSIRAKQDQELTHSEEESEDELDLEEQEEELIEIAKNQTQQSVKNTKFTPKKLQTPLSKAAVLAVQTEPRLKRTGASELAAARNNLKKNGLSLNLHELERRAWLNNAKEMRPFSQTKRELTRIFHGDSSRGAAQRDADKADEDLGAELYWTYRPSLNRSPTQSASGSRKPQQTYREICGLTSEQISQKVTQEPSNAQKIKAVRENFIATLEQCYGKPFANELFAKAEKEKFLAQSTPLTFDDVAGLIALADGGMAQGKFYLSEFQKLAELLQRAFSDFKAAQEAARVAQENYNALKGSPWQHLLATVWYAIRTIFGVVGTGSFIGLCVTEYHSMPVLLGVSSLAVGYYLDPATIHQFTGCLFIPDNFNKMRDSWGTYWKARAALSDLTDRQQELQRQREAMKKILLEIEVQQQSINQKIFPALKKELDQSAIMKFWSELQKKITASLPQE